MKCVFYTRDLFPILLFSINLFSSQGKISLLYTIKKGDLNEVKHLVKNGADPHEVHNRGENLVHIAAHIGDISIIEYLKKLKVDCNKKDNLGYAPVSLAVENGKLKTLKYLIEKCEVDQHVVDNSGKNLVHTAAYTGNIPIIEYLKKLKVDCNKKDNLGYAPVSLAVLNGKLKTLKYLIEKCEVDQHVVDDDGENLVHIAARIGDISIIEYLKKLKVDCNKKDNLGYAPVSLAVLNGKLETIKYLIEKCEVDPHVVDDDGDTLVHSAARIGDISIIEYLKKLKVDCNKKNKSGYAPVFYAVENVKLKTLKYLIEKCGASPYHVSLLLTRKEKISVLKDLAYVFLDKLFSYNNTEDTF